LTVLQSMELFAQPLHRTIVHMDMDCFFVSVSRLLNPKLVNKPVIVGGGDRGVVAACSYETRAFGVHSAMPMKMALRLCPEALIVRGDYDEYSKRSDEVMQIIRKKAPVFERSSIDEFYLDFTGMDRFFGCYQYATELRQTIIKETRLPISLGMSSNKTVSKIATDEAKPNNQMKIDFGEEKNFLAPLSVKKIPMVGEKTYHLLRSMGIEKVATVQQMPMELMQNVLGDNGISIWKKANGIDNSPVEPYNERKSISSEETFQHDTIDVVMLKSILIRMVEKLCFQLRTEDKLTSCVTVKIRYSNFDTHTMQCRLPYTSSDHTLIARVKELFDRVYSRRMLIRLVGVKFSHLVGGGHQIDLFNDSEHVINLYQAMDAIRRVYGAHAIERAVGGSHVLRTFNPFNGIATAQTDTTPKDKNAWEYLLLLSPPHYIKNGVWEIKKAFHKKHNHIQAIHSAPHITLGSFWLNEVLEEDVLRKISEVAQQQSPVEVILKNFKNFGTHTIYINVINPAAIVNLVKSLKEKLQLHGSQSSFSMTPHLTIARRLREEQFKKAILDFEGREFNASFIADSMLLMKREHSNDRYQTVAEFDFRCLKNIEAMEV